MKKDNGPKREAKWLSRIFVYVLVFALSVPPAATGAYAAAPHESIITPEFLQQAFDRQTASGGLDLTLDKSSLKESQTKLGTDLLMLTDTEGRFSKSQKDRIRNALKEQKSFLTSMEAASGGLKASAGDLVYVYVELADGVDIGTIKPYAHTIKNKDLENGIAAVWVQTDKIQLLSSLPSVMSVRTVTPPDVRTGSALSEGDALLKADQFRNANDLAGSGIKIGIISNGVDNMDDAVAAGDLPGDVHVLGNSVGGDEGTAMLEIVHDLAPGSELYFHDCGDNVIAFNQAIDDLANAGCQIICDDIGWLAEPYFEDGTVAKHVTELLASRNIVYFSAAGNSGDNHYQALYRDYYSNGYHYHDADAAASGQQMIPVEIPAGGYSFIFMQWNDKFGSSANDYDTYLYVYDAATDSFSLGATSQNVQNGSSNSGDPLEYMLYENTTNETQYALLDVNKYAGSSKTLEIFEFGYAYLMDYATSADSVFGHPAATNVIAVGAVNADSPDSIAYYSSQGPSTISYPSSVKRPKPDLCAIDGVDVTGAGGFSDPFYGTSAAAPHAAAVAALVWSQDPARSSSQIRSMMLGGTKDMGTAGFDSIYGYGLVDAMAAGSPAKPEGLGVVFDQNRAEVSWTANTEADLAGYELAYKADGAASFTAAAVLKTATSYTIANMPAGESYSFKLRAKDTGSYWSSWSDTLSVLAADTTPPPIPTGFSVTAVDYGRATLGWTASAAADLSGYRIRYGLSGSGDYVETDISSAISHTLTSLVNDQEYDFQIKAKDTSGNWSDYCGMIHGTPTDTTPPSVPTGFKAVLGSDCEAALSWTGNSEADMQGYEIACQKYGSSAWELSSVGYPSTSTIIAPGSGAQYSFKIRAYDEKGNRSAWSATVTLTMPAAVMTAVLDPTCKEGQEDGKTVSISLTNVKFASSEDFDPACIQITGLPSGVSVGDVLRINDHNVQAVLSGNSIADYDTAVTATVRVSPEGTVPAQGSGLSKTISFAAVAESIPAAPSATFSFIGDNAGRLMGIKAATMEYSLNGGASYKTAVEDDQLLTALELAAVNPTSDIRVRVKATMRTPAGTAKIIDIVASSAAPSITFSFSGSYAGKLVGSTTTMEYSLDAGASYSPVSISSMQLSQAELASITPENDIRVRYKTTATKPASAVKLINITAGPAAPALAANDVLNTVQGLTTSMEYKVNDGAWTKYTGTNAPYLAGDTTLAARAAAANLAVAGASAILAYTENPPLEVAISLAAPIMEGAEGGKTLGVVLTNGEFKSAITSTEIILSGLPAGITKGTVTRVSANRINILLTGNSTVDYDEDRPITVTIRKSQVLPVQAADITAQTVLTAVQEPVPAEPSGIGFSFDGVNAGRLTGSTTLMEFSLNGGRSYIPVAAVNQLLTAGQIASINDQDDIRVRLKKTLRNPEGDATLLDIAMGSELPDTVVGSDMDNTLSGLETGMEFSTNGGSSWTKYTGTNLPALAGTLNVWVRYSAAGLTEAGQAALFPFSAAVPELTLSAYHNGITEGAESGKIITVNLTNGTFVSTLTSSEIQLIGLPAGVSKGTVTRRSATQITIALSGNRTSDYGSDKTITISIGKNQVQPAQPASLTTVMAFGGADAAVPAAPAGISFSFSGTSAGKLVGSTTAMEYSIDGGMTYYPVTVAGGSLTAAQLASINAENDLSVRFRKTAASPAGDVLVLDLQPGQTLPDTVASNDETNGMTGLTADMEFSANGGSSWVKYNGTNLPALNGSLTLLVRMSAFDMTAAGEYRTFTFSDSVPAVYISATHNGITEGAESGKIITVTLTNATFKTTLTTSEIQLIGLPAGVSKSTVTRKSATQITIALSGNRTSDYGSDKTITVSIGKSQVVPAQSANLTTVLAIPGIDAAAPAAPTGVSFSFSGANAGKLIGSTTLMEYSVDGGSTYYPVTLAGGAVPSAQLSAINGSDDLLIRLKKTASKPAGVTLAIDILEGPAAPDTLVSDDTANTLSGIAAGMEFSKDSGITWTKYTGANLPALNGTLDLLVRLQASGMTAPGESALLVFTATNPELSITASHNGITEGAESGKIITVNLTNGTFKSTLTTSEIQLIGLPAGVTKGTVARKSSTQIAITLSGKSTSDYGSDKTITVSIGKNQVEPVQPANLTTVLAIPGIDAAPPAAPTGVTFSFDGSNAGKLVGSTTLMEYSIDGGNGYTAVTTANVAIASAQIAKINAEDDILIRLKKSAAAPAGTDRVIDIQTGPSLAGTVVGSDETNSIKGLTAQMEFRSDDSSPWTRYSGSNLPSLIGDIALQVRLVTAATGTMTAAGEPRTFVFTATNPELSINASNNEITEGAENGSIITITLENGAFADSIDESGIGVAGLPEGVAIGGVTWISSQEIQMILVGDASEDFDTDRSISVTVYGDQVIPAQPADLSCDFTISAARELVDPYGVMTGYSAGSSDAGYGIEFLIDGEATTFDSFLDGAAYDYGRLYQIVLDENGAVTGLNDADAAAFRFGAFSAIEEVDGDVVYGTGGSGSLSGGSALLDTNAAIYLWNSSAGRYEIGYVYDLETPGYAACFYDTAGEDGVYDIVLVTDVI